jgi:hypothetical protein
LTRKASFVEQTKRTEVSGRDAMRSFKSLLILLAVLAWMGIMPAGAIFAFWFSDFPETAQARREGRKDAMEGEKLPGSREELLKCGYIDLDTAQSSLNLKVGDRLFFTYPKWASVGIGAKYFIKGQTVVGFLGNIVSYDHTIRVMTGMTGADEGSGTFVFKAVRKGRTKLTIRRDFRGEDTGELNSVEVLVE